MQTNDTFFTALRCMDGRCEELVAQFGKNKFQAEYPDTITEAGLVKIISHNPSEEFIVKLKEKLDISVNKHHSRGIVVCGHQDCAANPVDDEQHKNDVRKSVEVIKSLINSLVPVLGVFVKRDSSGTWITEEL